MTTAPASQPLYSATDVTMILEVERAVPLSTVIDSEKSSSGWWNMLTPGDRLMLAAGYPQLVKWPAK